MSVLTKADIRLKEAIDVLRALGLPKGQQNERSALCLLALLDLPPTVSWAKATNPLLGITPIMQWAKKHYRREYAPNSRETFRRYSMHQFVQAAVALYNPDELSRPVNSPAAVYQIEPTVLALVRTYRSAAWDAGLVAYLAQKQTLADRYAKEREQERIAIQIEDGEGFNLSAGEHSKLIKAVIDDFGSRFVPGGVLLYAGDTGDKWGYFLADSLAALGVRVDSHGKMPDVVLHDPKRDWLLLIESVTSHGPVNAKRHEELKELFDHAKPKLVFVTAFPRRSVMARYLGDIAWETEVWVADSPSHLIHFDGDRFLGPYE